MRESISLTGQFAAVDEILTGRENLVLVAQLRHLQESRRDRGRAARPVLADRGGRPEGVDLLGWNAPPPRHRDEPDRQAAGDLPRRADDRARPAGAHRGVADRQGPGRSGTTVLLTTQYLDEAEHLADRIAILHRGRIIAERHPRRAQAAAAAGRRSSTSRSSPPSRRSSWPSSASRHRRTAATTDTVEHSDVEDGTAQVERNRHDHATSSATPPSSPDGRCATSCAAPTPSSPPRSPRSR